MLSEYHTVSIHALTLILPYSPTCLQGKPYLRIHVSCTHMQIAIHELTTVIYVNDMQRMQINSQTKVDKTTDLKDVYLITMV